MIKGSLPGAVIIEGHIQGLSNARSLGEIGIPVYIIDKSNCIAKYSKYCAKFFYCPDYIEEDFVTFLITLSVNENLNNWVLIPSNDHAVYSISKHRSRLEKYFKIITPDLSIISQIYNKLEFLRIAQNNNIPIPDTISYSSHDNLINTDIPFPVITKGINGLSFYKSFKRKAFVANNINELRGQLREISSKVPVNMIFTQEVIPFDKENHTISFTAFCISGKIRTYWMGMKIREHPIQFGTGTFAKSINSQECLNLSIPILEYLKYTGVCEIEYIFDNRDGQYKLIEMNPRTWLWVGLAKACGIDYAKIIYNYINNAPIDYPSHYLTDIFWINPVTDIYFAFKGILTGRLSIKDYIHSLKNSKIINALWLKGDLKPFFAYIFNIFLISRQR